MSYVQAFNNQWLNFLKEMSKSFPENKEIAPLRNQLLLATKADKNLPIKAFIDAELLYYKPYITAKNDKKWSQKANNCGLRKRAVFGLKMA